MTSRPSLLLTWIFFLAACSPASTLPQSSSLETQRAGVVKLRVLRPGRSPERATGVFVGKDSDKAYFITAFHAVKVDPDPQSQNVDMLHSVWLHFYTSPQGFEAFPLDKFDPDLDLAVVSLPVGNLPSGLPQFGVKDATAGVPVHVIGQPAAGDWSVAPGTVENENAPNGDIHHFVISRDQSLAEGHSGGPVLDDQGNFLGMHTESTPTYGREVKSTEIMALLKAWHVPTDNLTHAVNVTAGPSVSPVQADKDAIDKVIDSYADAYNTKNKNSLWKVWPNPSAKTKQAIEDYFNMARSITMKVTDRRIEPSGTTARATAQFSQEFIPKMGSPPPVTKGSIIFGLEKKDGTWVIVSVK